MLSVLSPWGATAGVAATTAVASAVEKVADSFSFADLLQSSAPTGEEPAAKADSLSSLRETAQAKLSKVQEQITKRLQAAGIDLAGPLPLELDAFGDIRLSEQGHAQASQIELLLNDDQALRQDLTDLQTQLAEIERLQLADRAALLHDLDPRAAAALDRQARYGKPSPLQFTVGT